MMLQLLSWCPGALGFFLRQKLYPFYLNKCGKKVLFGRFVKLRGGQKISIGNGAIINDHAIIDARNYKDQDVGITIEDNVFIGAYTELTTSGGAIRINKNSNIGSECRLLSDADILLEQDVLMAAFCRIGGTQKDKISGGDHVTKIDAGCWLGVRTVVCSGVHVGSNTVVGAHGVVANQLPSMVVAIGNPAKKLYSREDG